MARGRFISNAIMSDQKINSLSDDTSRLAFTWLITTADSEGRTHGDPAMVRSLLFPRRVDVTVEQVEAYISEWYHVGLIQWYKANGDLWIAFPNFEKYQIGLRKEREPESQIPPIDDGELQPILDEDDGKHPANIRQTSGTNKVKRSKEKGSGAEKAPRPRDELFDTIAQVCSVDPSTAGSTIAKVKVSLQKANPPYTPDDVRSFEKWWWADDFRKKRGDPPTVWKLQEQIGIIRSNGKHDEPPSAPRKVYQ